VHRWDEKNQGVPERPVDFYEIFVPAFRVSQQDDDSSDPKNQTVQNRKPIIDF
jgi:hypothetical protein